MVFRSITFRLTLYFAVASTIVLMAVAYLVGRSVDMHFVELDRAELQGKLELIRHALSKVHTQGDIDALPDRMGDALAGHDALAVVLFAPGGTQLFSTKEAKVPYPGNRDQNCSPGVLVRTATVGLRPGCRWTRPTSPLSPWRFP